MKSRKHVLARLTVIGALVSLTGISMTRADDGSGLVATSWVEQGGAAIAVSPEGDVTVEFERQGQLSPPKTYDLIVGGTSPSSAFTGDLSNYTGIRFRILGDGAQSAGLKVSILATDIYTDDTRRWKHTDARVSPNPHEWMINTVPLAHPLDDAVWTPLWDYSAYRFSPEKNWEQDLQAVDMIVLSITPDGSSDENYSISQFQLVSDDGVTEPAQLTPIQAYFPEYQTLQEVIDAGLADQDTDGDGMSDVDEIIAGMDPHSSASVFAASMQMTADGNVIAWDGVLGANYAVLRSTDLTKNFQMIASDIPAHATGPKTFTDTSPVEGEPNFYKIVKY